MKCFVAVLLFALVAIAMAEEKKPKVEEVKEPQIADIPRDKRSHAFYSPYTYGSYPQFSHNSLIYQPYAYPYNYRPYYYNSQPYYGSY